MRLIDADELKIKLADELSDALGETDFTDGLQHGLKLAISLAEETPIAEAKPIRHGKWIIIGNWKKDKRDSGYLPIFKCSCCHTPFIGEIERYHYCPNCGAKMDEIEEGEVVVTKKGIIINMDEVKEDEID